MSIRAFKFSLCVSAAIVVGVALPISAQGRWRGGRGDQGCRAHLRKTAAALVDSSLSVADEPDPLRRAEIFRQVAGALAERAKDQATSGDTASAERLALCCLRAIAQGITGNIEKVQLGQEDPKAAQADALLDQASGEAESLQGVLAKLPDSPRKRVAAALESCRQRGQGARVRLRRQIRWRGGSETDQGPPGPGPAASASRKSRGQGPPPWAGGKGVGKKASPAQDVRTPEEQKDAKSAKGQASPPATGKEQGKSAKSDSNSKSPQSPATRGGGRKRTRGKNRS